MRCTLCAARALPLIPAQQSCDSCRRGGRPVRIFFGARPPHQPRARLGQRDLACYGSTFHRTPNIDALAQRGMKFGIFLAPFHRVGENPTLGMRRDMIGVKVEGTGELSRRSIVWKNNQGSPDSCSPVVWDKWLFVVTDDGIARCFDKHIHLLPNIDRCIGTIDAIDYLEHACIHPLGPSARQ